MARAKLQIKPEAMVRIARHLGHDGDMSKFKDFLASDPAKQHLLNRYYKTATKLYKKAKGGPVIRHYDEGGLSDADISAMSPEQAQNWLGQQSGKIKGDTGDYSDLDTFKGYSGWDNIQGGWDTFSKVAKQAGLGKKDKFASDWNIKSGAGANAYKHTDASTGDGSTDWPQEVQDFFKAQMDAGKSGEEAMALTKANFPNTDGNWDIPPTEPVEPEPTQNPIEKEMMDQAKNPELKGDMKVTPEKIGYDTNQDIASTSGQVDDTDPKAVVTKATASSDATSPTAKKAETYTPEKSQAFVKDVADKTKAETMKKEDVSEIDAEQQTESSVSDLTAAKGEGIKMDEPDKRVLQDEEKVESAVDAKKASEFTEEIKAAQGDPSEKATMRYQVEQYMNDFADGKVPKWAAGAMRTLIDQNAAMGIQGSAASQGMMHAMLEKAIDLASVDQQTFAKFDAMNLSNRQQRALLAAEQRAKFMGQEFDQKFKAKVINASKVSDVANMNFTAEQQVALENSRIANTMNLANLNNKQALIMGEAAALANLDIANLNNRQQAAVQNAQNFLAVDMANLSNRQQTSLFKSQSQINSILSDTAASNAAKQFNAQSENQMTQFYDNLSSQVSMFNTAQENAMNKFNAGQENATSQFNAQIENQRDQFNAQNQLIVDQSNAQWRRQIATADTAATNRANEINASALLGISQSAYNNIWQMYGDSMEHAWQSSENELQRMTSLAQTKMQVEGEAAIHAADRNSSFWSNLGGFVFDWINPFD